MVNNFIIRGGLKNNKNLVLWLLAQTHLIVGWVITQWSMCSTSIQQQKTCNLCSAVPTIGINYWFSVGRTVKTLEEIRRQVVVLEDKPILTSFSDVPDKFGDFWARWGTSHIFSFQFINTIYTNCSYMFLFCLLPQKKVLLGSQLLSQVEGQCFYFVFSHKKGNSGHPILNLKMLEILEDKKQNERFWGQSGLMEDMWHLWYGSYPPPKKTPNLTLCLPRDSPKISTTVLPKPDFQ